MVTVHHLEHSRSQRVLWLLEELNVEYDIQYYKRDIKTNLAPESLRRVHPLGRSPVITDKGEVIAESAVITEYLIDTYDNDKLFALNNDADKREHQFWLHFAEATLMPALVAKLVLSKAREKVFFPFSLLTNAFVDGILNAYFEPNLKTSLDFVESHLHNRHGFVGDQLTGADIQMLFPLEALVATGQAKHLPAISAYVAAMHERPAYQQALAKGGEYLYATLDSSRDK